MALAKDSPLALALRKRLEHVEYHFLPPADGPRYAGGENDLDSDLAAVVLDFDEGKRLVVTWALEGDFGGLAIEMKSEVSPGIGIEVLDASHRSAWSEFVGERIVGLGASWQESDELGPPTAWSLRLDFDSDRSVVIALGTHDAQGLHFMPDELVVISDRTTACRYVPTHTSSNAWGDSLAI